MAKTLAELNIPGATLCVARAGVILFRQGFGWSDPYSGIAITPDTVMRIASISKPVTGMLILKLFEDELPAALERKVFGPDGLLPDARYTDDLLDPQVLNITLKHLLQHTGGWDSSVYEPQYDLVTIAKVMGVAAPARSTDVIKFMLLNKTLQYPPGTQYCYSNFGYNILGRIIEHHTGMGYEAAARKLILQPAGVWFALIGGDTLEARFTAETVYHDDTRWPPVPSQSGVGEGTAAYNAFHLKTMDSHAGWVMTSLDLVRFADAIDGRSGVPRLLKPSTIALMETSNPHIGDPEAGLAWRLEDGAWIHSGTLIAGMHSYLVRRGDGITWAVIYNSLPVDPANMEQGIKVLLAKTCKGVEAEILKALANPPGT